MSVNRSRAPAWFRIAAIALVLWGLMGCYSCVQQFRLGAEAMGPASDYDRALYAALPVWYNAVYAVAVGCGLLGAIALVARSVLSIPLFAISLIAVLIQFGWIFAATDLAKVKGPGTAIFPAIIIVIAAIELWLARRARMRGWIA